MRQYGGFADAAKTNERFKYLISQGQKGLSIAFDLPTQMGYNSDDKICLGEVGRVGVTVNSLKDFEQVFEGIPLDKVSTSMTINAPTSVLLAMYIVAGEKQGVMPDKLIGTVQNDILKEYIARGTYIYPPKPYSLSCFIISLSCFLSMIDLTDPLSALIRTLKYSFSRVLFFLSINRLLSACILFSAGI